MYIQAYRCHPEMSQFGFRSGIQPCMVCEELLQPAVRHRMSEQPFDCRKGACRHIGSRIEALDNMLRMTDRSGQHLCLVTISAVDLHDVGYQCHAVFGDVVETSHERRHVGRFAASNACPTENTSVQFVRISLAAKYFTARIPAAVQGSFTTMRGCSAASASPSRTIPSKSVAMTSALTSPSTMLQIST